MIVDHWLIISAYIYQRTLFVIEALLRSDVPDIYSYLDLMLEELNTLTSSEHSSIKAKATKVRGGHPLSHVFFTWRDRMMKMFIHFVFHYHLYTDLDATDC